MFHQKNLFHKVSAAIISAMCAVTIVSAGTACADGVSTQLPAAAEGVRYTDSQVLTDLVAQTQAGDCNLYLDAAYTQSALLPVDTMLDNNLWYYLHCPASGGKTYGKQCYIYAQGVFSKLFEELPLHGAENTTRYNHCTIVMGQTPAVTFQQFLECRIMPGAYLRTTGNADGTYSSSDGHSLLIMAYDADGVLVQEGNALGGGEILLTNLSWEEFNQRFLARKNRCVAHVVQPCDYYYAERFDLAYDFTLSAESTEAQEVLLSRTGKHALMPDGDQFDWESSDHSVVTVDENGVVEVVSDGSVTVTATGGDAVYTYEITVSAVDWAELGDADGNGIIDCDDAILTLRHYVNEQLMGASLLTEEACARCDVDNDGTVSADDSALTLRYYLNRDLLGNDDAEALWCELLA